MTNRSGQGHVGRLGSVPGSVLRLSPELDQFSEARLDHEALLLALVEKLLLSLRKGVGIGQPILLEVVLDLDVLWSGVDPCVNFAGLESGVEGGPGGHEELLLVSTNIDDAVFVLHQVLKAGGGVEGGRHTHGCAHEPEERH